MKIQFCQLNDGLRPGSTHCFKMQWPLQNRQQYTKHTASPATSWTAVLSTAQIQRSEWPSWKSWQIISLARIRLRLGVSAALLGASSNCSVAIRSNVSRKNQRISFPEASASQLPLSREDSLRSVFCSTSTSVLSLSWSSSSTYAWGCQTQV